MRAVKVLLVVFFLCGGLGVIYINLNFMLGNELVGFRYNVHSILCVPIGLGFVAMGIFAFHRTIQTWRDRGDLMG